MMVSLLAPPRLRFWVSECEQNIGLQLALNERSNREQMNTFVGESFHVGGFNFIELFHVWNI